jgi:malonate transporter MadM subunit
MEVAYKLIDKNGLVFAFLVVGVIMYLSFLVSEHLFRKKIPGVALAVFAGLILALLGSKKGIADIPLFTGMALLGGSMLRDFSVVATAMGADLSKIKQAGMGRYCWLICWSVFLFFCRGTSCIFFGISRY